MCHLVYTLKCFMLFYFLTFDSDLFKISSPSIIRLQHTTLMNRPHYSIKTVTFVYSYYVFWNRCSAWIYLDASTKVLDVMQTLTSCAGWFPGRFHDFVIVFVSFGSVSCCLFFSIQNTPEHKMLIAGFLSWHYFHSLHCYRNYWSFLLYFTFFHLMY